jgi:hypothetical protein
MAVTFNEGSYSIAINTGNNPIEDWLGLQTELLSIISMLDADDVIPHWRTINLIQDMLPDHETALKMFPRKQVEP